MKCQLINFERCDGSEFFSKGFLNNSVFSKFLYDDVKVSVTLLHVLFYHYCALFVLGHRCDTSILTPTFFFNKILITSLVILKDIELCK